MKSITSQKMPRIRVGKDEYELIKQYRRLKSNTVGKKEENGDSLNLTSYLAQSIEDIIKEYEIDTNLWECVSFKPGNWTTPVKAKFRCEIGEEGEKKEVITSTMPVIIENRKSEAVFKKKIQIVDYEKFRRELVEDLKSFSPKTKINTENHKSNTGNCLEINIPDLHLGKQCWSEETGSKNYDIKIAAQRFRDSFDDLLSRAIKANKFEKILFIVGNDLFNSDNAYPYTQTTAGTPMQDDSRWQKTFRVGRQLMIEAILKLQKIAPVEIKVVPGNHDFQKSFYLGEVLEAYFSNSSIVNIDNSPHSRKYFKWGKCLLGFAHGNRKDEGEVRLINIFKSENAKDWGDTIYREIHCGDIHHYKELKQKGTSKDVDKYAEDIDGVIIKYLRTLMFNDEWESKKGFNSQKGAHFFVWNKEDGNTVEYKYNK